METLVEVRSDTDVQIVRYPWVSERKTYRTIRKLVPSEVSLRIAGVKHLSQVKRIIKGIEHELFSTYSQTLHGQDLVATLVNLWGKRQLYVGHFG